MTLWLQKSIMNGYKVTKSYGNGNIRTGRGDLAASGSLEVSLK